MPLADPNTERLSAWSKWPLANHIAFSYDFGRMMHGGVPFGGLPQPKCVPSLKP